MRLQTTSIAAALIAGGFLLGHVTSLWMTTELQAQAKQPAETEIKTLTTRIGKLTYQVGYPTKETSQKLYDEMDLQRACPAYIWSVPAVSFASIRAGWFRDLGATYNDIILYQDFLDTKSIYLTGNNTTIYAASQMDLKDGPVVVEVPAGPTAGMFADLWFKTYGVGRLGPDKGYDAKAAEWRAKLAEWQPSTQPASEHP